MTHKAALEHALRAVDARLKELGDPQPADHHGDTADTLAAREEHEHLVLGHAGLVERKRLILAALEKVGTELEGMCEDCCRVIPGKRLHAIPWATHCVFCQARAEQAASRSAPPLPSEIPAVDEGDQ